jgi:hypothetical protein
MSVKVKFQGTEYWLLVEADGDFGALAPLKHCDEDGHVNSLEAVLEGSFAHLFPDGRLLQRGRQIGTREDLERI